MLFRSLARLTALFAASGIGLVSFPAALAQERPVAFTGATIIPIAGAPITDGLLLVHRGKITAVGSAATVRLSGDVQLIDATGKVIMPGLVDTHSHAGGWPDFAADNSSPIQPELRVLDGIDVRHPTIQKAQAGGITTANLMPGSGHLISGQTIYAKLRDARTIDDLLLRLPDGTIAGGVKMANGTNPRRDLSGYPGTRAKAVALVREKFTAALDYRDKLQRAGDDPEKKPARDLGLEVLVDVLEGRRVVQHHTHRHDDILSVLRLQKEFGFKVVLQHVSDGWAVAPEIAAAGVPCSVILIDSPGGKIETRDARIETAGILERAGVKVGFHTDDPICDSRFFLRVGALAVRGGMTREGALRALTVVNAEMLGLADRIGTLEAGKDADFILLSGDPFATATRVEQTWIEGTKVFDLADPQDRLWATGGVGAGEPRRAYLCCFGDAWSLIAAANAAHGGAN